MWGEHVTALASGAVAKVVPFHDRKATAGVLLSVAGTAPRHGHASTASGGYRFKVVRRRWVIERTLSWLRRNRRLMAHYEALAVIAEGFAKLAMINLMLK